MTIKEANNFYKNDEKKYELKENKNFLMWYRDITKDEYISYMDIDELQEFIDKIVTWYEIKYPERELETIEGTRYSSFANLKSLSKEMTCEQLIFRLTNKENGLLRGAYRTGCGGLYYNKTLKKYMPELLISFNRIDNEEEHQLFYQNEYNVFFDGYTGKLINFYGAMPYELTLEDDMTIESLYEKLKKINKFNLKGIRKCLNLHQDDLELRNMILQYVALKLLYSRNTIPEYGYIRAKKFIEEFNKELNLELSTLDIDKLINKDYSLSKKEKMHRLDNNKLNECVKEQKSMIKRMKK